MRFTVDGKTVNTSTGAVDLDGNGEPVVLLHGAGGDRTAWQQQTRWLAHQGFRAVAVDLPGHGTSDGPPLATIADLADWTAAFVGAAGFGSAHLVGHSMGSFIALETAARHPDAVRSIVLVGTAAAMPVHPALIEAATAGDTLAPRLMGAWGHAGAAHLGGHPAPGMWMLGGNDALVERALDGALAADFVACAAYEDALASAAAATCPATVVSGLADRMTPAKAAGPLVEALGATAVPLAGHGHMLMTEAPGELRRAIADAVGRAVRSQEV